MDTKEIVAKPSSELQGQATSFAIVNFTPEQKELLKSTVMIVAVKKENRNSAECAITDDELNLFCLICAKTGLNPFLKQIYGMKRYDTDSGTYKLAIQLSIDALRIVASRNPLYRGHSAPEWCGRDGKWTDIWTKEKEMPYAARVQAYHANFPKPMVGIAYWHECCQPTKFWEKRGISQLAKCATAAALRMVCPRDTASLYIPEEMPPVQKNNQENELPNEPSKNAESEVKLVDLTTNLQTKENEEKMRLYTQICTLIKDNNFDSQTTAKCKAEIGLNGTARDLTLIDFQRLKSYLILKSNILDDRSITQEIIEQAIKNARVSGDFRTMSSEEINLVTFALSQLTAQKFVAPSEDNMPDRELPDKVTSENIESKMEAIAQSAEATVAIDDSKKK